MNASEDKELSVEAPSSNSQSSDLTHFLLECEKDFGKRYTEEDEEYAALLRQDPPAPPIVCPWYGRPPDYSRSRGGRRNHEGRRSYGNQSNYRSQNYYGDRNRFQRSDDGWRTHENRNYDNRHRH